MLFAFCISEGFHSNISSIETKRRCFKLKPCRMHMKCVGNTYNDLDPVQCIGHIFFHNNKISFKISSHIYLFSHHLSGCTLPIPQCSGCFHHDLWHMQIILTDPHSCVTKVRTHPSPERWEIKQDLLLCFAFPHSPTSHVPPGPYRQPLPMVTGTIFCHQSLFRLLPSGNCRDTGTIWLEFPAGRVTSHLSQFLCEKNCHIWPAFGASIFSSVKWSSTNEYIILGQTITALKHARYWIPHLLRMDQSHGQDSMDPNILVWSGLDWVISLEYSIL